MTTTKVRTVVLSALAVAGLTLGAALPAQAYWKGTYSDQTAAVGHATLKYTLYFNGYDGGGRGVYSASLFNNDSRTQHLAISGNGYTVYEPAPSGGWTNSLVGPPGVASNHDGVYVRACNASYASCSAWELIRLTR